MHKTNSNKIKQCQGCGNNYSHKKGERFKHFLKSKYCSNKCIGFDKSIVKNPPSFIVCNFCQKNFYRKANAPLIVFTKRKFCSIKCTALSQRITKKGNLNANWQGGINPINDTVRKSIEYRLWRTAVFERDNYTCIWGGKEHGNKLNADHIKSFSLFPELRFAIDNGRTLCSSCHRKTDTYGFNIKKIKGRKITE